MEGTFYYSVNINNECALLICQGIFLFITLIETDFFFNLLFRYDMSHMPWLWQNKNKKSIYYCKQIISFMHSILQNMFHKNDIFVYFVRT